MLDLIRFGRVADASLVEVKYSSHLLECFPSVFILCDIHASWKRKKCIDQKM